MTRSRSRQTWGYGINPKSGDFGYAPAGILFDLAAPSGMMGPSTSDSIRPNA